MVLARALIAAISRDTRDISGKGAWGLPDAGEPRAAPARFHLGNSAPQTPLRAGRGEAATSHDCCVPVMAHLGILGLF